MKEISKQEFKDFIRKNRGLTCTFGRLGDPPSTVFHNREGTFVAKIVWGTLADEPKDIYLIKEGL